VLNEKKKKGKDWEPGVGPFWKTVGGRWVGKDTAERGKRVGSIKCRKKGKGFRHSAESSGERPRASPVRGGVPLFLKSGE